VFFDDGVPLDPSADPVVTTDLADLLELVVTRADASRLIPDPVVDSPPSFVLRMIDPTLTDVTSAVAIQDGGIELFMRVGQFQTTTAGQLQFESEMFDLAGSVDAGLVASAHLSVRKESRDAPVEVVLEDLVVAIERADGTFTDPEVTALFRLASGLLRATLEEQLRDAMHALLADSVPSLLADVLNGIDSALAARTITLDTAPLPRIELSLDGRMSRLDARYRRDLLAPLVMSASTTASSIHPESRGFARLESVPMSSEFFRDGSVALGVSAGFLNGLLHVLWDSGLVDLDLTPILPSSVGSFVTEAVLEAKLPPTVRPPRVGDDHDLLLVIGQAELVATLASGPARFGLSIEAGVDVELADNTLRLHIADEPSVRVWRIEGEEGDIVTPEIVRAVILDLWPELRGSIGESLAISLPIPPLEVLGGVAPDLATFQLTLAETDPALHPRGELLILDAALTGRVP
jgi:hypothetical protein